MSKTTENEEVNVPIHVPTLCHIAEVIADNLQDISNELKIVEGTPKANTPEYVGKSGIAIGYMNILNYITSILDEIKKQKEKEEKK